MTPAEEEAQLPECFKYRGDDFTPVQYFKVGVTYGWVQGGRAHWTADSHEALYTPPQLGLHPNDACWLVMERVSSEMWRLYSKHTTALGAMAYMVAHGLVQDEKQEQEEAPP